MFALIDAHNFYASVEIAMRPALAEHPFVVLSSNDGCIVARSEKARQLGIKMGVPWFKLHEERAKHGLIGLSGNMVLYSDFSTRMHSIIAGLAADVVPYSVDEAFAYLGDLPGNHTDRVWRVKERVQQWLGLPLGGGIGRTKTLAKLASHVAKQAFRRPGSYPSTLAQVCNLGQCDPALLHTCLSRTPVNEVWGIGPRYADQLLQAGINTALEFSQLDAASVRRRWGLGLERTLRELNGVTCIDVSGRSDRRQITVTRSLARPISSCQELERLVALFASNASVKLRLQEKVCSKLSVFAMTSPFRQGERFARSVVMPVAADTDDTRAIVDAAVKGVRKIWEPGYDLVRCGVMLLDLVPRTTAQAQTSLDLGSGKPAATAWKEHALMLAVDQLNERYGRKTVFVAAEETMQVSRADRRTPNYTTSWSELPIVRA